MKAAIRLQNHGCANHPYWWIVVAANRKNLKGRFLEHVGYWAPRQGVHVQRQIVLNVPRIKYWISCGAVPTHRVHKFLSIWNIFPQPWYQQKTQQELAALKKPQSQMTDKQKMKQERKRKKRQRQKLSPLNYHHRESKFKGAQYSTLHRYRVKLREKIYATERENEIMRQLLLHNEFEKVNRINELSGNIVYDDSEQLKRLQGELAKAKSELALIDKNFKNTSILEKIKVIQEINKLVDKIREVEKERAPFRKRSTSVIEGQNITQAQLDKKLQYELVTKKIEQMNEDFAQLEKLHEVVTLEEYANHLLTEYPEIDAETALQTAQELFIQRAKFTSSPLTKFQLLHSEEFQIQQKKHANATVKKIRPQKKRTIDGKVVESKWAARRLEREKREQEKQAKMKVKADQQQAIQFEKKPPLEQKRISEVKQENEKLKKIPEPKIIQYLMTRPDVIVPTNRPVHPFPDFKTYVPEEYYEPISILDLNITSISSLEPREELDKYHQKRNYMNPIPTTPKSSKKAKKEKSATL